MLPLLPLSHHPMTRSSATLLQALVVLFGIGTLAFLLWQPTVEGVNATATSLYDIYFDDYLVAYAYIASIPFFVALFHIVKVLGQQTAQASIRSLRTIRYCALSLIPLVIGGVTIILSQPTDDRPPVLMMGTVLILCSIAVATIAGMFERKMRG